MLLLADADTGIRYQADTVLIYSPQKSTEAMHRYRFIALSHRLHETEDRDQRVACHFLLSFRTGGPWSRSGPRCHPIQT